VISAPANSEALPPRFKVFSGGHPLPNQQSLEAAIAAFELLSIADVEKAVVIFLISGGGSAMLEWPVSDAITLVDLQETNRELVTCGATIAEINAVRRSISKVKGGALVRRAANTEIVTLIISDTNPGDEASVASGPTLAPSADSPVAQHVLEKYGLTPTLPSSVVSALQANSTEIRSDPDSNPPFFVLLNNQVAQKAAAERAAELGFTSAIDNEINEQSIEEGTDLMLSHAARALTGPWCFISGGEFACRVQGSGRGGRNLETVLRCAMKLDQKSSSHTLILSAGTDGIDGNSNSAGAIADENTIERARALGLDTAEYLRTSDSHAFFEALEDLIVTGPTGTNVRDLRLVLRA
jgi:glycerate 2-kinase